MGEYGKGGFIGRVIIFKGFLVKLYVVFLCKIDVVEFFWNINIYLCLKSLNIVVLKWDNKDFIRYYMLINKSFGVKNDFFLLSLLESEFF